MIYKYINDVFFTNYYRCIHHYQCKKHTGHDYDVMLKFHDNFHSLMSYKFGKTDENSAKCKLQLFHFKSQCSKNSLEQESQIPLNDADAFQSQFFAKVGKI